VNSKNYYSIKFIEDHLSFLDQTKLPLQEVYIETDDYERIAIAIEKLELRGAPLIGISAAFALALSFKEIKSNHKEHFLKVYKRLASTRPTAVNLFYALDRMKNVFEKIDEYSNSYQMLFNEAKAIYEIFGNEVPVSSTKSMTGHECWMAGASEVIYSILMMQNGFIAPNINLENPDDDAKKINLVSKTKNQKIDVFLSNSFGFGGTNSALIVKKFD